MTWEELLKKMYVEITARAIICDLEQAGRWVYITTFITEILKLKDKTQKKPDIFSMISSGSDIPMLIGNLISSSASEEAVYDIARLKTEYKEKHERKLAEYKGMKEKFPALGDVLRKNEEALKEASPELYQLAFSPEQKAKKDAKKIIEEAKANPKV